MISKSKIKLIKSLERKKFREQERFFVAEGPKLVGDLLETLTPVYIAALPKWIEANKGKISQATILETTDERELERASLLRAPQQVLALFPIPEYSMDIRIAEDTLCLALDNVQDPGNLGTIVRIADWFGIRDIFCSLNTADIYNPKAVQATMGALARVRLHYCTLEKELQKTNAPKYGTFLNGTDIYKEELTPNGIIIMGNEGNGISKEIEVLVSNKILIPSFPRDGKTSESLNVAIATSIVCAEFRRRQQ